MATPIKSGKQAVDLAVAGPRPSRIRRDPPPKVEKISLAERDERDRRMAAIGIAAFTMAVLIIVFAVSNWAGWTPAEYHLHFEAE